jgi:DNA-binding transcriptional regulator YiaG
MAACSADPNEVAEIRRLASDVAKGRVTRTTEYDLLAQHLTKDDICDQLSRELEAAIDDERRQRLGLLAPAEIRNAREKLGLTVQEMSHFLGVEESAYARWENGRSLPTKPGNELIRQMLESAERIV